MPPSASVIRTQRKIVEIPISCKKQRILANALPFQPTNQQKSRWYVSIILSVILPSFAVGSLPPRATNLLENDQQNWQGLSWCLQRSLCGCAYWTKWNSSKLALQSYCWRICQIQTELRSEHRIQQQPRLKILRWVENIQDLLFQVALLILSTQKENLSQL